VFVFIDLNTCFNLLGFLFFFSLPTSLFHLNIEPTSNNSPTLDTEIYDISEVVQEIGPVGKSRYFICSSKSDVPNNKVRWIDIQDAYSTCVY
jgi:hypothetical protein